MQHHVLILVPIHCELFCFCVCSLKVVDYGFVVVLLSALSSSLRPGGKVNHFVVNAFCKLLFLRKHPRDSRKHYFFSKVGVSSR